MSDDPTVETPCPRCGALTVWVLPRAGGIEGALRYVTGLELIEVLRKGCDCDLSDDEWGTLADEADGLLEEARDDAG